jgi:FAD binding domain
VNKEGRRFFDEMSPYSVTQPIVLAQDGPVWVVFDDAAKRASQPKSTGAFKKVVIPGMTWEDWVEPVIDEMVAAGKVTTAGSIADLARAIGVPTDGLTGTLEKYNADVAAGEDTVHLKKPGVLRPVDTPPFYATEVRLCQLSVTAVGPRIDRDGHVMNASNQPVPGLFAVLRAFPAGAQRPWVRRGHSRLRHAVSARDRAVRQRVQPRRGLLGRPERGEQLEHGGVRVQAVQRHLPDDPGCAPRSRRGPRSRGR